MMRAEFTCPSQGLQVVFIVRLASMLRNMPLVAGGAHGITVSRSSALLLEHSLKRCFAVFLGES